MLDGKNVKNIRREESKIKYFKNISNRFLKEFEKIKDTLSPKTLLSQDLVTHKLVK